MTRASDTSREVTDEAAFDAALGRLLRTAYRNDVTVRGAWDCRTDAADLPDWDVQITAVTKPDAD
ncbi:hypothetical protein ACFQH6_03615 [Halobacteriaceae archaeon GCM10025711]